jgi:DNA-binding NtrC family response regulator
MDSSPVNVLLIEDNAEHVALFSQLLGAADSITHFRLISAETLAEGLARLQEQAYALVLLDLSLPDSDGLETFIRIVEAAPGVAIVVLSGINDVALAIETVQLGAQDYLVKGHVDNHLLVRSMQYAIERKRVQLQLQRAHDELEARVQERTAMLQESNARLQKEIAERRRAEEETLESNRQLAAALGQLRSTQSRLSKESGCTRSDGWPMASRTISTTHSLRFSASASCC